MEKPSQLRDSWIFLQFLTFWDRSRGQGVKKGRLWIAKTRILVEGWEGSIGYHWSSWKFCVLKTRGCIFILLEHFYKMYRGKVIFREQCRLSKNLKAWQFEFYLHALSSCSLKNKLCYRNILFKKKFNVVFNVPKYLVLTELNSNLGYSATVKNVDMVSFREILTINPQIYSQ